jgi:hypothetical protein
MIFLTADSRNSILSIENDKDNVSIENNKIVRRRSEATTPIIVSHRYIVINVRDASQQILNWY